MISTIIGFVVVTEVMFLAIRIISGGVITKRKIFEKLRKYAKAKEAERYERQLERQQLNH